MGRGGTVHLQLRGLEIWNFSAKEERILKNLYNFLGFFAYSFGIDFSLEHLLHATVFIFSCMGLTKRINYLLYWILSERNFKLFTSK